jgi:acyl carrier protein
MTREEILKIVLNQVEQINDTFPEDQKIVVNETTILFGNGSSIDSLSLVSIIVDLEMIFSSDYNKEISITDDRAMTREISPFDSVASLVDYIFEIINEN